MIGLFSSLSLPVVGIHEKLKNSSFQIFSQILMSSSFDIKPGKYKTL